MFVVRVSFVCLARVWLACVWFGIGWFVCGLCVRVRGVRGGLCVVCVFGLSVWFVGGGGVWGRRGGKGRGGEERRGVVCVSVCGCCVWFQCGFCVCGVSAHF